MVCIVWTHGRFPAKALGWLSRNVVQRANNFRHFNSPPFKVKRWSSREQTWSTFNFVVLQGAQYAICTSNPSPARIND
jgi:hypothetical protein